MIKYILILIFTLINYKYFPLVYTFRFTYIIIKNLYWKKFTKNTKILIESTRHTNCSLFECDFFGFHKSNSTYFTELDLCRTQCVLNSTNYFINKLSNNESIPFIPLASIHNSFLKEIKPLQNYQMHSKIVSTSDKWVYVMTLFTISNGNNNNSNTNYIYNNRRIAAISIGKLILKDKINKSTISPSVLQLNSNLSNESDLLSVIDSIPDLINIYKSI